MYAGRSGTTRIMHAMDATGTSTGCAMASKPRHRAKHCRRAAVPKKLGDVAYAHAVNGITHIVFLRGNLSHGVRFLPARTELTTSAHCLVAGFSQLCRSRETRHGVQKRCCSPAAMPQTELSVRKRKQRNKSERSFQRTFPPTIQACEWTQVCRSYLTVLSAPVRCASNRNFVACNSAASH